MQVVVILNGVCGLKGMKGIFVESLLRITILMLDVCLNYFVGQAYPCS